MAGVEQRVYEVSRDLSFASGGATLGLAGGLLVAAALRASDALMMGAMVSVMALLYGLPSLVLALRLPDQDMDDE